jgi:hypothetical protein
MRRRPKPNPHRMQGSAGRVQAECTSCGEDRPLFMLKPCEVCDKLVCVTCRYKPAYEPRMRVCSKCVTDAQRGT